MHNLIKVKVEGKNINNYILWLIKNKINITNVSLVSHNEMTFLIEYKYYNYLKKYSKTYTVSILEVHGKVKFIMFMKQNFIILISIIISLTILYILSNIIFSVDIVYNNKEIVNLLNKELNNYNIKKYQLKKSYDNLEIMKKEILENNKDKLEWLEILESGTKYIVKVVERKQETKDNSYKYQSITAKKNAIIYDIKAYNGEKLKEKNDYVKKDTIIISGILNKANGEIIYKKALGQILGEVWYETQVEFPYFYKEEQLTGRKREVYTIKFINKSFPLFTFKNYHNFKKDEIILVDNNIVPIKFIKEKQYEVNIIEKIYTEEEVIKEAITYAKEKLQESNHNILKIKDYSIMKKENIGNKVKLKIFFSVIEDITKIEEIKVEY